MSSHQREVLKAAILNGFFWSMVLLVLTYFRNGLLNMNYMPIWFIFFAATGAIRKHYLLKRKK
jgi:hypothetical protein